MGAICAGDSAQRHISALADYRGMISWQEGHEANEVRCATGAKARVGYPKGVTKP